MKNYFTNKKNILIIAIASVILMVVILIILSLKSDKLTSQTKITSQNFKGQIINDNIIIPVTTSINGNEGEVVARGEYKVKLQPQTEAETVYITKAKFTLKEAYNFSQVEAIKWSKDAKLIFIKSNGALGLDGKSSSWQLVFGSVKLSRAYEIIIVSDQIVSAKDINSDSYGFALPTNWYDSGEAITSLQNLPQFKDGTVSTINFYYSSANDSWAYGLASGELTTSMWVK